MKLYQVTVVAEYITQHEYFYHAESYDHVIQHIFNHLDDYKYRGIKYLLREYTYTSSKQLEECISEYNCEHDGIYSINVREITEKMIERI